MNGGDRGSTYTTVLSTYQATWDTTLTTVSSTDMVTSTSAVISNAPSTLSPVISKSSAISRNPGPGDDSISSLSVGRPAVASVPSNSSPRLGAGAIAGIAIGGILLLILIIGAWCFWRLRKRVTFNVNEDEYVGRRDEKVAIGASPPTDSVGVFDTEFHELPVTGRSHGLEPPQYHSYTIDPVHELDGSLRPGELPSTRTKDASPTVEGVKVSDPGNTERSNGVASPDAEARRRREVEWLEMEEARIRQRRETLLQQSSSNNLKQST
ncbi:hypothetical protein P3342_005522 [Pyrenophora teres f. teres]|uniref:Uncharacterized protein n=2 Tax=Pyrenophora teres f. teres TaxID=97479 RepID=E3RFB4_PYRTT|nr:hypothetical protein PTT_05988 [Pyrenophora teres f. teres 0-1]KAK1907198.1 hypothetical protein P3342_005522 [Pyrenophora teres f. teres]